MALFDPRAWPERDPAAYHAYLDQLAAVAGHLLRDGRQVELFATNVRMDRPVLDDLHARVPGDVSVAGTDTVSTLLDRLAGYDCVIVSRYHAALLALAVGTPAVALAYHPKVRALMAAAGQEGRCLDARATDVDPVVTLVRESSAQRGSVVPALRTHAARCRDAVERQFDLVFGEPVAAPTPPRAPAQVAR
jgi:polysaccharide pyruvyl transferase WcaK-like protein